jgi:hypothetical protein
VCRPQAAPSVAGCAAARLAPAEDWAASTVRGNGIHPRFRAPSGSGLAFRKPRGSHRLSRPFSKQKQSSRPDPDSPPTLPDAEKRDRILNAFAQLTAEDLLLVAKVLRHTNSETQAEELLASSLQAVDDPEVRMAVSTLVGARSKT